MGIALSDAVVDYFAASPIGSMLLLPWVAADQNSPISGPLEDVLAAIPDEMVARTSADDLFQFFAKNKPDIDREARIWLAKSEVGLEIARRRLVAVREDASLGRPRPYDLQALSDLEVDSDHLVPLSAFEFDGARLSRNGQSFLVLTTTGSPNSTHWLLRSIYEQGVAQATRVRLDPFLFGPEATFPAMHYLMHIYGRPLNWARVSGLKEPEFGQWRPDAPGRGSEFTDYAWTPRGDEVHFVCEEVPRADDVACDPARYLHAVYDRRAEAISHFDGALRLYDSEEILQRQKDHVRNAGKIGVREKVFRYDGAMQPDDLSVIAQAFFVWNEDVRSYFGGSPSAPVQS